MKLESAIDIQNKKQKMYSQLAFSIFMRFNAINPSKIPSQSCKHCGALVQVNTLLLILFHEYEPTTMEIFIYILNMVYVG